MTMDDGTDKVIMLAKGGYVSENPISSQGIARALRNHGYRGGVVIVEDWNQKDISDEYEPRRISKNNHSVQD